MGAGEPGTQPKPGKCETRPLERGGMGWGRGTPGWLERDASRGSTRGVGRVSFEVKGGKMSQRPQLPSSGTHLPIFS